MKKKTKTQSFAVFLAGLICVFIVLEAALFTGTRVFTRQRQIPDLSSCEEGTLRILCLGDSFTFGLGAPKDQTYPAQLEKILQNQFPEQKVKVFNRGVCALNTSGILKNLEQDLKTTRPRIVTLMAGDPNFWDFRGMNPERSLRVRMKDFFSGLHSVKLVRLLLKNIQQKQGPRQTKPDHTSKANIVKKIPELPKLKRDSNVQAKEYTNKNLTRETRKLKDQGKYQQALQLLEHAMAKEPGNAEHFILTGIICREQGQTKEALEFLEYAKKLQPENPTVLHQLGLVKTKMSDMKTATRLFLDAIALAPDRIELYNYLPHSVTVSNSFDYASQKLEEIGKSSALAREYAQFFRSRQSLSEAVTNWIERDIEQILAICKQHGAKVMLLGYPHEEERASFVLERLAKKHGLLFVDNLSMFQALFLSGARYEEYFCPDTHPNAKGYALIAQNIARSFFKFFNYKSFPSETKPKEEQKNNA